MGSCQTFVMLFELFLISGRYLYILPFCHFTDLFTSLT